MSLRGTTFVGFGIRIDIFAKAALFAFQRLSIRAAAVVAVINELTVSVIQFESAMADVERMIALNNKSLAGLSDISDTVRNQILYMSSTSIYSVQELAKTFEFLLRAGMSVEQAMKELWRTEQLSLATGMELNDAASTRIRIMNMWASAGYKIVNLNDQLAQSEIEFTMTTEDLMTALNMVGSSAALAGLSFAETATMIGALIASGKTASKAGTTLRAAFKALVDPSEEVKEVMSVLGLSWEYLATLPIEERMLVVGESIMALPDPVQRLTYSMMIFNSRASEVLPVLTALRTNFDETVGRIENAAGASDIAAQAFKDNLAVQLKTLGKKLLAIALASGIWILIAATKAKQIAEIKGSIATKVATIWDYISLKLTGRATRGLWGQVAAYWAATKAKNAETGAEERNIAARLSSAIATGGASVMSVIYTMTIGAMTMALKVATQAARGLMKALGPIGIILMIVGVAMAYLIKNTDIMSQLMTMLSPILNDFKDIWSLLGDILSLFMSVVGPILKAFLIPLMMILKVIMIPLRIFSGTLKVLTSVFMILFGVLGPIFEYFSSLFDVTKLLAKPMEWLGLVIEKVGQGINFVVDGIIWLINTIIKFFNTLGANMELIKTTDEMAKERAAKEKTKSDYEKEQAESLGSEPDFTNVQTEDVGDVESPEGYPTPTGDINTPTGTTGGTTTTGGVYGDGGGMVINITIMASLAEMMDEEAFAEYVGRYAIQEYRRQRGITV